MARPARRPGRSGRGGSVTAFWPAGCRCRCRTCPSPATGGYAWSTTPRPRRRRQPVLLVPPAGTLRRAGSPGHALHSPCRRAGLGYKRRRPAWSSSRSCNIWGRPQKVSLSRHGTMLGTGTRRQSLLAYGGSVMPGEAAHGAKSTPPLRTLADKVNWLISTAHPADRGPCSNAEVAALIRKTTGERVSHTTIWKLRNGQAVQQARQHRGIRRRKARRASAGQAHRRRLSPLSRRGSHTAGTRPG